MTQRQRVMSKREVLRCLSGLICSDSVSNGDKLKAIDIMNKMRGHYAQKGEEAAPGDTNITIEVVESPRKTEEET